MNYRLLFRTETPVRTGLIGTGAYGNSFLSHARRIPNLRVLAVCDQNVDAARRACVESGVPSDELVVCKTAVEARTALDGGKTVVTGDGALMAELPLDVLVEATGAPEAGARHGLAAIQAGQHVVMVSKEAAAVVGPILAAKARDAGVVYTTAEGDQPSLCIGLLTWAESLGLEVVCAGKFTDTDAVYDGNAGAVKLGRHTAELDQNGPWDLWPLQAGDPAGLVETRSQALAALPQGGIAEYTERAIVMNDTGYRHDGPTLHVPIVRLQEIAEVLRPARDGGILGQAPAIDAAICLRRPDEPGTAGGVFVVVGCHDRAAWEFLGRKGHLLSRDRAYAALYLPYHLLGVETATSVLSAAVLGLPTGGGEETRPMAEVGIRAAKALSAGHHLALDERHAIAGTAPIFTPPAPAAPDAPIPFYMAAHATLTCDVEPGALLTYSMVEEPQDSVLWALKREQDRRFLS